MIKRYPESWYEQRETFRAFCGAVAMVIFVVSWSWILSALVG